MITMLAGSSLLVTRTETFGLYESSLSIGTEEKGLIAAMVGNPTLVLADEPTGALDSKNAKLLLECFDDLNKQLDATILMVTHDSFAASYCRRVLFIRDGSIFTELIRGDMSRRQFFDRIMEVVAMIGGDQSDVL